MKSKHYRIDRCRCGTSYMRAARASSRGAWESVWSVPAAMWRGSSTRSSIERGPLNDDRRKKSSSAQMGHEVDMVETGEHIQPKTPVQFTGANSECR
ncbi:protein of unknown function [Pararobbsia alpina]